MTKSPDMTAKQVCRPIKEVMSIVGKGILDMCCIHRLVAQYRRRRGHQATQAEPRHGPIPIASFPLYPRWRSLTLPFAVQNSHHETFSQSQSTFMTKLPLELRRMIYKEVLGGVDMGANTSEGKLSIRRIYCYSCRCRESARLVHFQYGFQLAILKTCRQIYLEATEYLYTDNVFSFSNGDYGQPALEDLSHHFHPYRLTHIRDLRVDWKLDKLYYYCNVASWESLPLLSLADWKKSWNALRAMTGLRKARIFMYYKWHRRMDCYEELWKPHELEILKPVQSITAPTDFVLVLPDRRCPIDFDVGDSKCVLQLPENTIPIV